MKKIIIFFGILFCGFAHSAQIVNVEYIHNAIANRWDITVPYNPALTNPRVAANMKYLLSTIDVANEMLNGEPTTYGTGEYATTVAADTVATNTAVDELVKKTEKYVFSFVPSRSRYYYELIISAAGTFYVDWGDGTKETIEKQDTILTTYKHAYSDTADTYTIKLGGRATAYSKSEAAVLFWENDYASDRTNSGVSAIDGCLGCVFPTLADGSQPIFRYTFYQCESLKVIPENLFFNVIGAPFAEMFYLTFYGCSGLTGNIPSGLFARVKGRPASYMFSGTFEGCSGLTSIPENLFAGISGPPASYMFQSTFSGCSGLTSIPENLFAGISGPAADGMFGGTFSGCSGLTSIPENLFAGISGPAASSMFQSTFSGCSGLTGSIPSGLFAGISGPPASYMFQSTFRGCSGLTGSIPENLFGDISGVAASNMFAHMFFGCTGLTGPSARINRQYLYEIWPDEEPYMYSGATGLSDYNCIPTAWGGGGKNCLATDPA